jgi:ADP-glucose pyrophosphorylase
MNGAIIKKGAVVEDCIIGPDTLIDSDEKVNRSTMASRSSSTERRPNNMKDVIALLDCHNSPELGELTSSRPLASTSFLGRYAFADFALSNFCNSEIQNVGILVKDHQRSSSNTWAT